MHRRHLLQSVSALAMTAAAGMTYGESRRDFPLWEIRSDRTSVFLLGHTPPRPDDWMDERIQGLLRRCGHLWNETHHGGGSNAQELVQRYGIDPGQTLESRLHREQRDRLSKAAKAAGVPEGSLTTFRPWLAGQELEDAFFSAPGFNGRNADQVLIAEAQQLSIPVLSEFATLEEAVRWFSELPAATELQYLLYIIDEILAGHEQGQRIYAQWAAGREKLATAWLARMARLYPELYQSIAVERNRRWVPRVHAMLEAEQPTMIVVGLYHLVGPDRIQVQLARSGLNPRPM